MTRQNKDFRVFVWQVFNAVITFAITYITGSEYAVFVLPVLNFITKYVNTKYFGDVGVR